MRLTHHLTLPTSRLNVWRVFDNPANLKKWQPTLTDVEPAGGFPGRVGAVTRLTYNNNGRALELTEVITERAEPYLLVKTLESPNLLNTVTYRFVAVSPDETRWEVVSELVFQGIFSRMLGRLQRGGRQARLEAEMARFQQLVEEELAGQAHSGGKEG